MLGLLIAISLSLVSEYLSQGAIIYLKLYTFLYKGWKFAKIDAIVQNGHFIG